VRLTDPRNTHYSARPVRLEATETEYPEPGLIASYIPLMRRAQPPVLGLALVENYVDEDDPLVFALSAAKLSVYSRRVNTEYSLDDGVDNERATSVVGGMLRLAVRAIPSGMDLRVVAARFRENEEVEARFFPPCFFLYNLFLMVSFIPLSYA